MKQNYILYCVLITLFSLTQFNGHAQIIFTDIADMTLGSGGSIEVNMDGTGEAEFIFEDMGWEGIEPAIVFNENHSLTTVSEDEWDVLDDVASGEAIDANSGWFNYGDAYVDPGWASTPFPTNTDAYLGAKFPIGSNIHYGWICVEWDGNGTFTVKSFAYENTPNTDIAAGDQGSSSGTVMVSSINLQSATGVNEITETDGTLQILATVLPENADDPSLSWSILNMTGTGTISQSGLLTAVEDGNVRVFASANDGSGSIGTIDINISGQTIYVTSITVSGEGGENSISTNGGSLQMYAAVLPENADNSIITWEVENGTGSASIDNSGLLTAISDGTVIVTATSTDGSEISGEIIITISNQTVSITSIIPGELTIYPNPASDQINIETSATENDLRINIFSISGQKVMEGRTTASQNTIDVSELMKGTYILEIQANDHMVRKQFIKQ